MRDALLRMYRAAKAMLKLSEGFKKLGIGDEPIFNAYGDVADSIYYLLGEEKPYEDSVTRLIVETMSLEDERATRMLMNEYEKHHDMPAPNTIRQEDFWELYKKNGGYMVGETR